MSIKSRNNLRGSRNPNAALTPENVLTIRKRYAEGVTQAEMCRVYGVSITTSERIVNWQTWNWLRDEESTMPEHDAPLLPITPEQEQAAMESAERLKAILAKDGIKVG